MLITNKLIENFNPCKPGINNFNKFYPNYSNNLSHLLSLGNIPYNDKIWLVRRVVDTKTLQQWAVECAEFVLHIFEDKYPDDKRPRECINATKDFLEGRVTKEVLARFRSNAAAAASAAAYRAAYNAAASAAASAYNAEEDQRNINLSLLIALLDSK